MSAVQRWFGLWATQRDDYKKILDDKRCSGGTDTVMIMKLDAIGDFIIFLDSAGEYRRLYPDKKLVLICSRPCVALAQASGCFDECITPDELEGRSCDVLIQTVFAKTRAMDVIAASIPAKEKISTRPDDSRVNLSRRITSARINAAGDAVYDRLIETGRGELMELNRNAAFIRALGRSGFRSSMPVFPEQKVNDGIVPDFDYFILFPGASSHRKSWPADRFASVMDEVCAKTHMKCLVCGALAEKHLFDEIMKASATAPDEVFDYLGRTTLIELMEVIRHAKLLIGNDTSGIHFAAAAGTRCVCIAGDFVYGRFIPYAPENTGTSPLPRVVHANAGCAGCALSRRTWKCRMTILFRNYFGCILDVSVADVMKAVQEELNSGI